MKKACSILSTALSLTVAAMVAVMALGPPVAAEEVQSRFDPTGRLRVETHFLVGAGIDKHDVGYTTTDDTITMSGGGGAGLGLEAGYCPHRSFEISGAFGFQSSKLSEKVENAEGSFKRIFFRVTAKYRIPVSMAGAIKVGAGGGYYSPSDLDLDFSEVPGGAHNIYSYDGAAGFHVSGEYEHHFASWNVMNAKWSLGAGVRYYKVEYDLNTASSDGENVPLNHPDLDCIRVFDGAGVDFFGYLAAYF